MIHRVPDLSNYFCETDRRLVSLSHLGLPYWTMGSCETIATVQCRLRCHRTVTSRTLQHQALHTKKEDFPNGIAAHTVNSAGCS